MSRAGPPALRIPVEARGARLDHAARDVLAASGHELSVREVRSAIRDGRIRVDGRRSAPGRRVEGGERLDTQRFVPRSQWILAPRPDLLADNPVVFQAEEWFVLNKSPGLPTLPRPVPGDPALLLAAMAVDPAVATAGPPLEGGAVHRLDNETSGIVVFARTEAARSRLRRAFAAHRIAKGYEALVEEREAWPRVVRAHIVTRGGPRVRVVAAGDEAAPESWIRRLSALTGAARVEVTTRWGRRHQVRAHLAWAGMPIRGDRLYAPEPVASSLERLALHAAWIELDGERVEVPSGWETPES